MTNLKTLRRTTPWLAALAVLLLAAPAVLAQEEEDLGPLRYDSEGRRDPFRPLIGEGAQRDTDRQKYAGTLRGLLLEEVKLTAIVQTAGGNVATFEGGPKREGFFAREGDQFWNGTIHSINFETGTVVVRQEMPDPKQRLLKPFRDTPVTLYPEIPGGSASLASPSSSSSRRGGVGTMGRPANVQNVRGVVNR